MPQRSKINALAIRAGIPGRVKTTGSATVLPSGPGMITTLDAAVGTAATCRNAIDAQSADGITGVGTEYSEANAGVCMVVGGNRAPWRCFVSNDGRGPELMFFGSEGTLRQEINSSKIPG